MPYHKTRLVPTEHHDSRLLYHKTNTVAEQVRTAIGRAYCGVSEAAIAGNWRLLQAVHRRLL